MTHHELPHDHGDINNVLDSMPDDSYFEDAAMTFSSLSDGTRLRILWLLCHSTECVSNISAAVGMSNAAVSHHLQLLKRGGLIVGRRVGKEIHYTLADTAEAQLLHRTIDSLLDITCPTMK